MTAIDAHEALRRRDRPEDAAPGRRHPRGLRQRQRLPDALGQGPAALGPDLGVVPQRLMGSRWIWRALAIPGLVVAGASSSSSPSTRSSASAWATSPTLYEPVPHWNPLDWNVGYIWAGAQGRRARAATRGTSSCARSSTSSSRSLLSLAIGYPVAWYAARHAGRWRGPILVLLVLPFWISYLMRMFAWTNLLDPERLRGARAARAVDRHAASRRSGCSTATTGSAASTSR